MATSAFKSTSKRGTTIPSKSSHTHFSTSNSHSNSNSNSNDNSSSRILRRSHSVSAVSRTKQYQKPQIDIPSEFSNKRDNPLFSSSNDAGYREGTVDKAFGRTTLGPAVNAGDRGRSVTRNSTTKTGIGRSVSRVRGRSVSRLRYGAYESEKEEMLVSKKFQKKSEIKRAPINGRNTADVRGWARSSQSGTGQGQVTEYSEDDSACSLQTANWEDVISNGSMSEAEEETTIHEQMKSVRGDQWGSDPAAGGIYETVRSEVRRAISDIQTDLESAIRRNKDAISMINVTDIPPDLVNPGTIGLVLDIRKEYSRKLEESEERARKLREDLAVEEHRGLELSRILKEIVPEPNASNSQRSRIRRRTSSERKNVSKRLSEEAMAYFDECVSISTFDSSDFSAPEDLPHSSVATAMSVSRPTIFHKVSESVLDSCGQDSNLNHRQISSGYDKLMHGCEDSVLTANSSSEVSQASRNTEQRHNLLFSTAETPEISELHYDIRSYAKHFQRDVDRHVIDKEYIRSSYDAGQYKLQGCLESFLFDKVMFKNRIESGSLHLCGGAGLALAFSPFGPAF